MTRWTAEYTEHNDISVEVPEAALWMVGPVSDNIRRCLASYLRKHAPYVDQAAIESFVGMTYRPGRDAKVMTRMELQDRIRKAFPSAIVAVEWVFLDPVDFTLIKLSAQ